MTLTLAAVKESALSSEDTGALVDEQPSALYRLVVIKLLCIFMVFRFLIVCWHAESPQFAGRCTIHKRRKGLCSEQSSRQVSIRASLTGNPQEASKASTKCASVPRRPSEPHRNVEEAVLIR